MHSMTWFFLHIYADSFKEVNTYFMGVLITFRKEKEDPWDFEQIFAQNAKNSETAEI